MTSEVLRNTTVIIPAYNEEEHLPDLLDSLLSLKLDNSKIVIAEDGSTDQTPQICSEYAEEYEKVKCSSIKNRLGKGTALKKSLQRAETEYTIFIDGDNSCNIEDLVKFNKELLNGQDLVIGSKYSHKESELTLSRKIQGKAYNFLARKTLGTNLTDHQCGLKGFKTQPIKEIFNKIEQDEWFYDTEIIYHAKKKNLKIKEIPVKWKSRPSKVPNNAAILAIKNLYRIKVNKSRRKTINQYSKFAIIGAIGALINTLVLYLMTEVADIWYMASAVVSTETSIISMFLMNNKITFKPVKKGFNQLFKGIINSNIVRSIGILLQLAILYALTETANLNYLISNIFGIIVASFLTFYGEKNYNWSK